MELAVADLHKKGLRENPQKKGNKKTKQKKNTSLKKQMLASHITSCASCIYMQCIHSKKCWVVLTQFWVKYGQTHPIFVHILPKIGLKQPSIF